MRLIRLKVRNMASLKGEHEIDFLDLQRHSSLFAITGETGSGKSTILNSIGLALYGQIYKKNVNQIDIVTLGEKEGLIELIFQVKGKFYLADWRVRVLKQNGEAYSTPQTPTRNLYAIEGSDFTSAKNIATVTVPELLNLDFDQFCKCIILNQGEFARFLTSSFSDRKEILEKLYPGEMLESMGRELKLELDGLQKIKEGLDIELKTLVGDNVSGEELQEEKKLLEKNLLATEEIFKKIEKLDYHFISLTSYHQKYNDNQKRIKTIHQEMNDHTSRYNELLKNGQIYADKKEALEKELETRLPALQALLQKEENLKNLSSQVEQGHLRKKKYEVESLRLSELLTKALLTQTTLKAQKDLLQKDFSLPLDILKEQKSSLNDLFDLYSQMELVAEELKGKKDRLKLLESQGKETKEAFESAQKKLHPDLPALEKELLALEAQKKSQKDLQEKIQRATIQSDELKKTLISGEKEVSEIQRRMTSLNEVISRAQEDLAPLETTLKLQEMLAASEVCVSHALSENLEHCPVCDQEVAKFKWLALKENLAKNDFDRIKNKARELTLLLIQSQEELKLLLEKSSQLNEQKTKLENELGEQLALLKLPFTASEDLDKKIDQTRKIIWDHETQEKEVTRLKTELTKTREQYGTFLTEIQHKDSASKAHEQKFEVFKVQLENLVRNLNGETISLLKKESRLLTQYLEKENELDRVTRDKEHFEEQTNQLAKDLSSLEEETRSQVAAVTELKLTLDKELRGQSANQLIQELTQNSKNATLTWNNHQQELKKQELQLKEFQSRLYELDKLTKDYDLQFSQELHIIKEISLTLGSVERSETNQLLARLKQLSLEITSESELFSPLQGYVQSEKNNYKTQVDHIRMQFASSRTRLEAWEKLQDKVTITRLKLKDITEQLDRRARLFEVLGKDELRTFVLSLVEENLIEQTNQELQKLCQGRYEILHQSKRMKMTPEFFILDKFREGGLRKISTLSGGETFMVSLAMALGLAEMTRGQAEIDSLFIDEGFGTLDQDSLEDVLDMLQQIQTRGLMVGIISHIKALTNSLAVNLVLNKTQDGTSSISMRIN